MMLTAIYTTENGLYTQRIYENNMQEFLEELPDVEWKDDIEDFNPTMMHNGIMFKGAPFIP